jgi:signal transduction histidine kinase
VAEWLAGESRFFRPEPGMSDPLVPPELAASNFLCARLSECPEPVLRSSPEGFTRWHGMPLQPLLREGVAVSSVLSVKFETRVVKGRLFWFDKPNMTADDLALGELAALRVSNVFNEFHLQKYLAQVAVQQERMRLSRDLHDGVLQALAGIAVELENVMRLLEGDSSAQESRLREIQNALQSEQRGLRLFVQKLRTADPRSHDFGISISRRFKELGERVERQRGIRMECHVDQDDRFPEEGIDDLSFLAHEAVTNAARHSGASTIRLAATSTAGRVTLVVSDNGHGFPFKGQYDLARLTACQLGPTTLKERVSLLGGRLVIESTDNGSRVEMSLPIGSKAG